MMEEAFFIDMGFVDGKFSGGGPLAPWNKDIGPGPPSNLDSELTPDHPVFSTRFRQQPSMASRDSAMGRPSSLLYLVSPLSTFSLIA